MREGNTRILLCSVLFEATAVWQKYLFSRDNFSYLISDKLSFALVSFIFPGVPI